MTSRVRRLQLQALARGFKDQKESEFLRGNHTYHRVKKYFAASDCRLHVAFQSMTCINFCDCGPNSLKAYYQFTLRSSGLFSYCSHKTVCLFYICSSQSWCTIVYETPLWF